MSVIPFNPGTVDGDPAADPQFDINVAIQQSIAAIDARTVGQSDWAPTTVVQQNEVRWINDVPMRSLSTRETSLSVTSDELTNWQAFPWMRMAASTALPSTQQDFELLVRKDGVLHHVTSQELMDFLASGVTNQLVVAYETLDPANPVMTLIEPDRPVRLLVDLKATLEATAVGDAGWDIALDGGLYVSGDTDLKFNFSQTGLRLPVTSRFVVDVIASVGTGGFKVDFTADNATVTAADKMSVSVTEISVGRPYV